MRALVASGPDKYALCEVPKPSPAPGWALIRVLTAAFCATDLEVLCGGIPARYPIIPGHEWCGVVESVNDAGAEWVGKTVVASNDVCCLTCPACRSGLWRNCPSFGEIGFAYDGAYAQYLCVPVYALRELPATVSPIQGAMLEPLGVALGTLDKVGAKLGETLLILGAGPIGLNMLAAGKAAGMRRIAVVDRISGRLERAVAMGAPYTLNGSAGNMASELQKIYPNGPDIVIECTGSEECLGLALSIAPKSGRVALAGYAGGRSMTVRIDDVHVKNLHVVGSGNNWNVLDRCIDLVADGVVSTECLCTELTTLARFDDVVKIAMERLEGYIKTVFDMRQGA